MATAQNTSTRVASANPSTTKAKPTSTPAAATATLEMKPTKAKKEKKPILDKLYTRFARLEKLIGKTRSAVRQFKGQGTDLQQAGVDVLLGKLDSLSTDCGVAQESVARLSASGFKPAVKQQQGSQKVDFGPNVRVWVKAKRRNEYLEAFSTETLDNLYVDRVIGTKILVRIGEASSEGKVARMAGFIPRTHITTTQPKA